MKIKGLDVIPEKGMTEAQVLNAFEAGLVQPKLIRTNTDGVLNVVTWSLCFSMRSTSTVVANATVTWRDASIVAHLRQVFPDLVVVNPTPNP
jgi:hypothetical protein